MTEELMLVDEQNIENMIYEIRGKQVMLDSDLAKLYKCTNGTKEINQAVNRNKAKFPDRFSWILNDRESEELLVTICDQKKETRGGKYKNPRVFTEEGVAMLATILKSRIATEVTINIMDTFIKMRRFLKDNLLEQQYINSLVLENRENIKEISNEVKLLQDTFNKLEEKEKINTIFCEGQIYDANSLLLDILNKSKKEIIIIDNYAGKELLDILKNINKKIIIISSNIDDTLKKKYEKQYSNVIFKHNTSFHDRFIIIDKKELYSCGSSFKDLGNKCFALNKMEDKECLKVILNNICK